MSLRGQNYLEPEVLSLSALSTPPYTGINKIKSISSKELQRNYEL